MQHGRVARGRMMLVKASTSRYPTRVAVVVSKKVYKSAVKRNKIRRRIFNIVRHEVQYHIVHSTDIVITVFSPETLLVKHDTLRAELTLLLQSVVDPKSPRS
jgi:ribonuclease P protein component